VLEGELLDGRDHDRVAALLAHGLGREVRVHACV
jgi:hypothetical protein